MPSITIDPTARVSTDAELSPGVTVGAYTTIEDGVTIGPDTSVGPYCRIQGPTTIGASCSITGYASIGTPPQDHSYKGEDTRLVIGDHNTIREFVTINRGTVKDKKITTVGNHNLIMAYCHVAHDCVIHDHVVMGNLATLGGHVQIFDHAILGGMTAIHQFTRIGSHAILGGGSMVSLDIIPYAKASGDRAKLFGINTVGLKRSGFSKEQIQHISRAYRILLKQGLLLKEAIEVLRTEFAAQEEIQVLVDFLSSSSRGIAR